MLIFDESMPRPEPALDDAGFWQACAERRLVFRCCEACGHVHHPPRPLCPRCQSTRLNWREATGPAQIFSYTRVHHPAHPAVRTHVPYDVVLVVFPEMQHVRLVSNLVDGEPRIGARVALVWDDIGGGAFLPRFRIAD